MNDRYKKVERAADFRRCPLVARLVRPIRVIEAHSKKKFLTTWAVTGSHEPLACG